MGVSLDTIRNHIWTKHRKLTIFLGRVPKIVNFQGHYLLDHSALMLNLIKLFRKRKQLSQHQCLTPIESGITSSQILQIQNSLD